jgi:hypothetical protein
VPTLVNTFFEKRVKQIFDLAEIVDKAFSQAGIEYRVVGGLAAYLYVEQQEPDAGRLTRDIDLAVRREDLDHIANAVKPYGLAHRRVAGIDMLVQSDSPSARRAVHLVFVGEKVRQEYPEAVPSLGASQSIRGIRLMPLPDLIRMKLTSFRSKDETHIKDLDEAGLITPEIEASLSSVLRERLGRSRMRE